MPEGSRTNQLYSWGMGENYVLGSRDDDNQFFPYVVHPKMFEELPVLMVGAGTQHVVVLTSDSQDHQNFPQFTEEVVNYILPLPAPKVKPVPAPKSATVKKQVEDEPMAEVEEEKKGERSEDVVSTTSSKKRKREEFEKEAILQPPMEAIVEKIEEKEQPKQENVKRRKVATPAVAVSSKGRSKSVVEKKQATAPKKGAAAPV
jgi:Regulator of chromosome condensation (RCC1) repeat